MKMSGHLIFSDLIGESREQLLMFDFPVVVYEVIFHDQYELSNN